MKFADFYKLRIKQKYVCHLEPDYDSIIQDFKDCKPKVKDRNCIKCLQKFDKRKG